MMEAALIGFWVAVPGLGRGGREEGLAATIATGADRGNTCSKKLNREPHPSANAIATTRVAK
jgi:hypothetical protein